MPFGTQSVELSTGEQIDIPLKLRMMENENILRMYNQMMEDTHRPFLKIKRTKGLEILKALPSKRSGVSHCVDYYLSRGHEGFESMLEIMQKILDLGHIDEGYFEKITNDIKDSRNYLTGDYWVSIEQMSQIGDHCMIHSLSNSLKEEFSADCEAGNSGNNFLDLIQHSHKYRCRRCDQLKNTLEEVPNIIHAIKVNFENDEELQKKYSSFEYEVTVAAKNIYDWKKHILRSKFSNNEKRKAITEMEPSIDATVTIDYMQRMLKVFYMETQQVTFVYIIS